MIIEKGTNKHYIEILARFYNSTIHKVSALSQLYSYCKEVRKVCRKPEGNEKNMGMYGGLQL